MMKRSNHVRFAFTLTELLVVMGIIAVLGTLTALGYRSIANDAKLSSGKNTVMAVLDNARALAMKNNQIVLVVFRPRLEGTKNQYLEAVTAKWSGQTGVATISASPPYQQIVDRFVPIPNVPARTLSVGIKIAEPYFAGSGGTLDVDNQWITSSHLPAINQQNGQGEVGGEMIAVMYAPDGTTTTRNSATDSARLWVDFDNDGLQKINGALINYFAITPPTISEANFNGDSGPPPLHAGYFEQFLEFDEPFLDIAPFVAVFDDDKVREQYDVTRWNNILTPGMAFANRRADYTTYVTNYADRIHFNRYTGVAMK